MSIGKDLRFKIISDAQKYGISATCKKHNISRTIYYRWLKRYQSLGIDGLSDIKKDFIPTNKTTKAVETSILDLIRSYPTYGPRAIKYLLDEIGHKVSESAVFNVMKRHHLTNRTNRLKYAKKRLSSRSEAPLILKELGSGECWLFWITDMGCFSSIGQLYAYTLIDYKSRIACTRLYSAIKTGNFEDLMTAVALPIAQTLNFKVKYLCLLEDKHLILDNKHPFDHKIAATLQDNGFDVKLHKIKLSEAAQEVQEVKNTYVNGFITSLMPLIKEDSTLVQLKLHMQKHVRQYNMNTQLLYDTHLHSPIGFHSTETNNKHILPLWAYIDRHY